MPMPWANTSKGITIKSNSVLGLTPDGKKKAEEMSLGGDLGDILSAMNSGSSGLMVVSEISDRTGIPEKRIVDVAQNYRAFIQVRQGTYE
jgi:hypothetical protein